MLRSLVILASVLALGCSPDKATEATGSGASPHMPQSAVAAAKQGATPAAVMPATAARSDAGLTPQELAAEAPAEAMQPPPVTPDEADRLKIEILTEAGYPNQDGQLMIDLLEQDYAYLAVQLTTADGRPVAGAAPELNIEGGSRIMPMTESEAGRLTNADGIYDFAVIGGQMNLDRLTVTVRDARAVLLINVISLQASGFPSPDDVDGALPWATLAQARISYEEDGTLLAQFPSELAKRDGQTVKLAGFMMPLEPEHKQKHFLLTSNPPSCFFHIPGGPTGAVEIKADQGIAVDWDLLVLQGRLQTVKRSDLGVVYRLLEAEVAATEIGREP